VVNNGDFTKQRDTDTDTPLGCILYKRRKKNKEVERMLLSVYYRAEMY